MKHAASLWVLDAAATTETAKVVDNGGYAGVVTEILSPAAKLGIRGEFIIRGPGSTAGVPKSLQDLFRIDPRGKQILRNFTMPRIRPFREAFSLAFYVWYSQSATEVTPGVVSQAVMFANSCGAKLIFDDWPHMTERQRLSIPPTSGIEPNWTSKDEWSWTHPCYVSRTQWLSWRYGHDWIITRGETRPMRTILYDYPNTDDRNEVLKNCRDLIRIADEANSRAALTTEIIRHEISLEEINRPQ